MIFFPFTSEQSAYSLLHRVMAVFEVSKQYYNLPWGEKGSGNLFA